jgi:hypothetical protein
MTHKKNRDLKAELAEAQIAAQHWENLYLETRAALVRLQELIAGEGGRCRNTVEVTWDER